MDCHGESDVLPDDDPRPFIYSAYFDAEISFIMARERQKYAEDEYKNLKRKF